MHYGACLCGHRTNYGRGVGTGGPESEHRMFNGADARSILDLKF
jgi:hypothetical protein